MRQRIKNKKGFKIPFKNIISLTLALMMVWGVLPLDKVYGQDSFEVTGIHVYRTFQDLDDGGSYGISVSGTGLNGVTIRYQEEASDEFITLTSQGQQGDNHFKQFKIDPGINIAKIKIGNLQPFDVDETGMPMVNEIDPDKVDTTKDEAEVKIVGKNFKNFGGVVKTGRTTIFIGNNDLTKTFRDSSNNEVRLDKDVLDLLKYGNKHITIEKELKKDDVSIKTTYNQRNAFRIYESINIDEDNVTIYPNRGKAGTQVNMTLENDENNYSVFFLEDETKPFMYENMGEDPYYPSTTGADGIIRIRVPKGLDPGRTYKLVITNNLDTISKTGEKGTDLTDHVTKQQVVGDFYVVGTDGGPYIEKVDPREGTSAGSYVTIYGYRFEELNINGLENVDDNISSDLDSDTIEIVQATQNDPTKLRINYDNDEDIKYNGKKVENLTRDFLVTIGTNASFSEADKDKNVFKKGANQEDKLYVKTGTIDGEDLKDPKKDVVIEITTTIKTDEGEYVFTEVAVLPGGYTFLPSHQDPTIEKITPDKIQVVDNGSSHETKENTILSIEGKNFNVFRYMENGDMKTNYPKVVIGGSNEDTAEIIIEKDGDGQVYYYEKDDQGKLKKPEDPREDVVLEVLDKNGMIVNGVAGREEGDSIVVTIPKGLLISTVNTSLPVAVSNPKRNSEARAIYSYKNDVISFITDTSDPIIEKVDPYIVTVEGGEDIVISGRNFQDGIKIFIDGKEITNVVRDIDTATTRGTLKFKAPRGREGENIIQIMNPDGGSDTHEFIYVKTMKIDPIITTIAPNKGTKDALVIIKGDNFLKTDQTITDIKGLGIHKLIGSRIYLGGEDVNKYTDDSTGLGGYATPNIDGTILFAIEENSHTNLKELVLSAYYESATLEIGADDEKEYYKVSIDYEGNPVVMGKDENYTIKLIGDDIKAIDDAGNILDVESESGKLIIKSDDSNEDIIDKEFTVTFNYNLFSIATNEFGYKNLRVADYYDSLILEEEIEGERNGDFYTIEVDDNDKVILSNGKNNIYEIKLDDEGKKVAIKGSDSYFIKGEDDSITIYKTVEDDPDAIKLTFKTPYFVDPQTKMITGHRAKVKNRNEIWITIPQKNVPGFYDVMVRNPDTKSFTVKNGFEYLNPQSKPKINYITPNQGSVDGGYDIVIHGEDFKNNVEVYIAGVKIPEKDVKVDKLNYQTITVTVPKYPGNIDTDFITDRKFVPITVLNEDGGSASTDKLFAYVIASSNPRIDKINPVKASAAGGDVVEIWGYDFRYFEPYKGETPKAGDTNYEDLNRDGEWTNYINDGNVPNKIKKPLDHKLFSEYIDSPVLPKIFFGNKEAKIVEFREGYMKVIIPRSSIIGGTNVYILNNDGGTSNKVKFTYEGSNPNISAILPNVGRKQGGEKRDVIGSNFKENNISVIDEVYGETKLTTHLVRFGEISNRQIPREAINSGLINQGSATVNLAGGLKAEHKVMDGKYKIELTLVEENIVYKKAYDYDSGAKYINIKGLEDEKGNNYKGHELIKVEVDDGRLLVDRGYSHQIKETFKDHLEVTTPSHYSTGNVNVVVENPDGLSNKVIFEYKNPDSNPQITNITRDGEQPLLANDGANKILTVNITSQSKIAIEGTDFREDAVIQIGNLTTINPNDINYQLPNRLEFDMPLMDDNSLNSLHRVVVINEDGGTASSDSLRPPIYIQFIKGESSPTIESITPDKGPATGGTSVTIKGKDFRETMEGYTGKKLKVYFDGKALPDSSVRVVDYKTVIVITPPGIPGTVEVKVENPDTETTNAGSFTYLSNPKITAVVDPVDPNESAPISVISILGGQEIKLKGTGFMEGAKVYFAPKLTPLTGDAEATGNIIYIDGSPYILEEGTEGTDYKWIDNETVLITTPQLKAENFGVIVVNPDGGASYIYTDIVYGIPEIAAPSGVVAELVYDRFIRVHWNAVTGASEYEIHGVINDQTTELIGTTKNTSFAYSDLEARTRYRFIVKAVGDFGSSQPSMESNTVRTGSVVGPPDEDGGLSEDTTISKTGNVANVVIGSKDRGTGTMQIDLTRGALAGSEELVISLPASVITDSRYRNIQVIGKDYTLEFSPSAFNVATIRENSRKSDAGVRFKVSPYKANTQVVSGNQLSTTYNLEASIYVGNTSTSMDYLAEGLKLVLDFDAAKARLRNLTRVDFSYFDTSKNSWQNHSSTGAGAGNSILGNINRLGRYTIIGSRR